MTESVRPARGALVIRTGAVDRGRTIREAVALAIEVLPEQPLGYLDARPDLAALRAHVMRWVHDYAVHRGVIMTDHDIASELEQLLADIRGGL